MYKLRSFVPLNILKNIYHCLIYSQLVYDIESWGSAFKIEMDKLQVSRKRAVRLMTFNDKYPRTPGPLPPSEPIFRKLGILNVRDVYKFQVSRFIFKSINKLAPTNFHKWFNPIHNVHRYGTRSNTSIEGKPKNTLFIPYARTTNYGLKQLKVDGPRIWNNIPHMLR